MFQAFYFSGFISQTEDNEAVPVQIMRDTGASHSMIVKGSVSFSNDTYTGDRVVIRGLGETITVPLCSVYLKSDLVSQLVVVWVQESLLVDGVSLLHGNNIAGSLVVPDPIVTNDLLNTSPIADVERLYPDLYPACAVTRSQAWHELSNQPSMNIDSSDERDLNDLFSEMESHDGEPVASRVSIFVNKVELKRPAEKQDMKNVPVTCEMLIDGQQNYPKLVSFMSRAVDVERL